MKRGFKVLEPDGYHPRKLLHQTVTKDVIGAAYEVHQVLGYGFLEKVYQKALQIEMLKRNHTAETEHAIPVRYKGITVGDYFADLVVDGKVIVELKVAPEYNAKDEPQLLNLLRATNFRVGLLINFGKAKVEFKRLVLEQNRELN